MQGVSLELGKEYRAHSSVTGLSDIIGDIFVNHVQRQA